MTVGSTGVRAAEYASLMLAALNLAAAAWAASSRSSAGALKMPLLLSFGFCFVIALLIASRFTRLARRPDATQPTGGDLDGLRFEELRGLLQRSPVLHRIVGALGLAILVVTLVLIGGVTWTTDAPFEQHHAVGMALYISALYAIASPVLAALARLPSLPDEPARCRAGGDR